MRWVQLRREGTGDVSLGKVIEPRKNTHEGRGSLGTGKGGGRREGVLVITSIKRSKKASNNYSSSSHVAYPPFINMFLMLLQHIWQLLRHFSDTETLWINSLSTKDWTNFLKLLQTIPVRDLSLHRRIFHFTDIPIAHACLGENYWGDRKRGRDRLGVEWELQEQQLRNNF